MSFPDDPFEAPTVPEPIKPTAFVEDPCASLTSEQQKKFNLDSGEAGSSAIGGECLHRYTNVDRWIRIDYATDIPGLERPYENGARSGRPWEPEVLDNYPAVATYAVDRIAVPSVPPSCYYMVGVNDDLYFAVLAQDADGGSECTLAREIAERSGVATDLVPATATDFVQLPAKMIAVLGDGVGDLSFDRLDAVEILPGDIPEMVVLLERETLLLCRMGVVQGFAECRGGGGLRSAPTVAVPLVITLTVTAITAETTTDMMSTV